MNYRKWAAGIVFALYGAHSAYSMGDRGIVAPSKTSFSYQDTKYLLYAGWRSLYRHDDRGLILDLAHTTTGGRISFQRYQSSLSLEEGVGLFFESSGLGADIQGAYTDLNKKGLKTLYTLTIADRVHGISQREGDQLASILFTALYIPYLPSETITSLYTILTNSLYKMGSSTPLVRKVLSLIKNDSML